MGTSKLRQFLTISTQEGLYSAFYASAKYMFELSNDWRKNHTHYVKYGSSLPNPYDLIYANPQEVNWMIVPRYIKLNKFKTYLKKGDWDKQYCDDSIHYMGVSEGYDDRSSPSLIQLENFTFYNSIDEHFNNGTDWEDTVVFNILLNDDVSNRYSDMNSIQDRFSKIDCLYNQIKEYGYKTQRELQRLDNLPFAATDKIPPEKEEVLVNIGRDGEIIFCTGRHRFCVARVLGIEEIPVRVHVRHKQWQEIRHQFYSRPLSEIDESIKKYRTHPDIRNLI